MSLIRINTTMQYVDGISDCYIFVTGNKPSEFKVEDYGYCSDEALIEIIARCLDMSNPEKDYILKQLCKRMPTVKLRKEPLTQYQVIEEDGKRYKKEYAQIRSTAKSTLNKSIKELIKELRSKKQ